MGKVNLFLEDEQVDMILEWLGEGAAHSRGEAAEPLQELLGLISGQRAESSQFVEKATEYKEVAGLVCMDLDLLNDIAQDTDKTAEQLRKQIAHTVKQKDEMIADASVRQRRYSAAQMLFNLPPGAVRSDPL